MQDKRQFGVYCGSKLTCSASVSIATILVFANAGNYNTHAFFRNISTQYTHIKNILSKI